MAIDKAGDKNAIVKFYTLRLHKRTAIVCYVSNNTIIVEGNNTVAYRG